MERKRQTFREWLRGGDPGIWLTAGTVSFSLIMVFGLLFLIMVEGMGHFWPKSLVRFQMLDATVSDRFRLGEIVDRETVTADQVRSSGIEVADGQELVDRTLLKTGNRDVDGFDFYWFLDDHVQSRDFPLEVFTAEREEWGNFYGTALGIEQDGKAITVPENVYGLR